MIYHIDILVCVEGHMHRILMEIFYTKPNGHCLEGAVLNSPLPITDCNNNF